ncbi:diacylglycerol kinase epsilon [Octopus bimaculoides]|uniref:diacylglycerol kinase epsilon n=1 Tax=Octopus bimaculoides TaxID=37653 RepID=UPI0022E746F8|nr:diacylglycerol kinase epsilon [Octopus bimaculoides]XP_052834352.1 diacylglycerol kinase epsilon [Octopus bimaculoides]XP_052834353.1 diacylglycerol kinase epsilon [Octopus bimaculoides]XP_052834354.1 diacylglycerol kinase epsilon [Octopus bimaculoides]XP_052834355.1 diacylglycerol kinase epsilon [Octopus bimaculoides]
MELLFIREAMYMVLTIILGLFIARVYRRRRYKHYEVRVRDVSKGHRWMMVSIFPKPTYCVISQNRISDGAQCHSCSICVDAANMKEANQKIPCKPLSVKSMFTHHQWGHGNLPLYSICYICNEPCNNQLQLCDYICSWCQRCVHTECFTHCKKECDLGPYKTVIVPPHCVTLKWVGLKGRQHLIVDSVKRPNIVNWSPLIVIANRKSGNNDGESILQAFRSYLNPAQVIDICDITPEPALKWCHLLPSVTIRVLVCGGDGTIGWVLNAIERLSLQPQPQICILPMGTGNDLSQVLGWGEIFTDQIEVPKILDKINQATVVQLDRWNLDINHSGHFRLPYYKKKNMCWNNYFSIGVDALVALNFHRQRESWPTLLSNRIINKVCYFMYGTKDVLERECHDLQKKLTVELDGKKINLPKLEGLVVLNISSWAGGCRVWEIKADEEEDEYIPASYNDGMVEVFGLHSSFHVAQLQVGMIPPIRIGQASRIKITLNCTAPMQVDGEPWLQQPVEMTVTHRSKATMLSLC